MALLDRPIDDLITLGMGLGNAQGVTGERSVNVQLVRIPSGRAACSEPALRERGASPRWLGRGPRRRRPASQGPASELRGVGPRGRSGCGCPRTGDLAQRDERTPEVLRGDVPAARHEGNEQNEHVRIRHVASPATPRPSRSHRRTGRPPSTEGIHWGARRRRRPPRGANGSASSSRCPDSVPSV